MLHLSCADEELTYIDQVVFSTEFYVTLNEKIKRIHNSAISIV